MNFIEKLDILNLTDGKSYTVCETYEEKNIYYLMLVENLSNGDLSENVKYAKVIVLPTRKFGIETIEDAETKQYLANIFLPMFKNDYEQYKKLGNNPNFFYCFFIKNLFISSGFSSLNTISYIKSIIGISTFLFFINL